MGTDDRGLEKTVIPSFARHPAEWAILVIFVLLPPIWTIVGFLQRVTQRRKTSKTAAAASAPAEPGRQPGAKDLVEQLTPVRRAPSPAAGVSGCCTPRVQSLGACAVALRIWAAGAEPCLSRGLRSPAGGHRATQG